MSKRFSIPLSSGKRLGPRNVSNSQKTSNRQNESSPGFAVNSVDSATAVSSSIGGASFIVGSGDPFPTGNEGEPLRRGSPFAAGTIETAAGQVFEGAIGAHLPLNGIPPGASASWSSTLSAETAKGAIFASCLILPFALLSATWFPLGSLAVAVLGMTLALLGVVSRYPRVSIAVFFAHITIAAFAYVQVY